MRQAEHPLYMIWSSMLNRCKNPNCKTFKYYGGKGVSVCERWTPKSGAKDGMAFRAFVEDMGERPENHSIDRIDSNGNYEPKNCKWSTQKEQMRNTQKAKKYTVFGFTGCLAEIAEQFGHSPGLVRTRFFTLGYTLEDAVSKPKRNHVRKHID